jgi:SulP family sulfate permease
VEETAVPFPARRPRFRPRLVEALAGYNREKFLADLGAGLTVGVVALSLCIGLGIAS